MAKAIILDIEGTTTPIDFVHRTLFPYSKARVAGFVQDNFDSLKYEIEQLVEEKQTDTEYSGELRPNSANSVSDYLKFLIDRDRKSTPLKAIQGMIWRSGYEAGDLVSAVFDDVPRALERWKRDGKTIAIYSSGSALAQRLLFRYTDQGDLSQYIDKYFDTTVGGKKEPESYERIASELARATSEILFISDSLPELDTARVCGFQTALSLRKGNPEIVEDFTHQAVRSFDDLLI